MTGSNKILTVSYGTFSCTLEGFDDPFGTMRGIAEYFRDLAADDRYFGAEPPTPDVEMLQNIAQKEVQRRVETRITDNSIAIRQVDDAPQQETVDDTAEPVNAEPAPRRAAKPIGDILPEDELDHGPLAIDDEYLMSDEPEDVLTVDADAEIADGPPAESIAEKLRRIRAVVSRNIEPQPAGTAPEVVSADEDTPRPRRDRAFTRTLEDITADLEGQDDIDPEEDADAPDDLPGGEATEPAEAVETGPVEDRTLETIAAVVSSDAKSDVFDMNDDAAGAERADASEAEENVDDWLEDDDDDEAGDEADTQAAIEDDDVQLAEAPAAEVQPAPDVTDDGETESETSEGDQTARRVSRPLDPISEDDGGVGRILAETDTKLQEDEGVRRRRVISQMRAAVAATKADRFFDGDPKPKSEADAEEQSPYRKVLSEVVQTATPETTANADRPAPLVLVSSQRVDETQTGAAPKRVSVSPVDASNFAEFADKMGARELPELLEAAAAYSAFVEGQPHFSRPEIMKRVARVDPALGLSREAGLRSFGQLLREGKIRKLQRGQFTVSEDTKFNPADRIAGQ